MFDLQKSLNERIAALNGKKTKSGKKIDVSKESIERSLKRAGILDENGNMIKRNFPTY